MKKVKYIATLIAVLVGMSGFAQSMFEGEIILTTSNKDLNETAQISWLIKGSQHKMVFNTVTKGESYSYTLIFSTNDINAVMLSEVKGQKAQYSIPLSAVANPALAMYYKIVQTDQTDNVAGFKTTQYVIESPGSTTICKAADVPNLRPMDFPMMLRVGGVMKAFTDKSYTAIPLSISTLDSKTGEVKFTQNIVSITPRSIGANEFVIGAEWKKM